MDQMDIVGIVFLVGVVACVIAVSAPDYTGPTRHVWDEPSDRKRLNIIASNPRAWRWSSAWWGIGSVLNALAFGLLVLPFSKAGETLLSISAAFLFLLAVLLWLVAMAFRMGLEPLVVSSADDNQALPAWFRPVESWGLYIMLMYMVFAYSALAILGWVLLRSALIPGWIGWFTLMFGGIAAVSIVLGRPRFPGSNHSIFGLPILPHLSTLMIGLALLTQA